MDVQHLLSFNGTTATLSGYDLPTLSHVKLTESLFSVLFPTVHADQVPPTLSKYLFKFNISSPTTSFTLRPNAPSLSPSSSLSLLSHPLHITATLFNPLLGGKGGFGALLKAAAGKAGAKKTTDFGACRDLNGRRLRHVNDQVKLTRWKRNKEKEEKGEEVEDEGETASGIENWHLGVPTWAGGKSNKEKSRSEKRKRGATKVAEEKKQKTLTETEQKKSKEDNLVNTYVGDFDNNTTSQDDLNNVVLQQMRKMKEEKGVGKMLAGVWSDTNVMDCGEGSAVLWQKGGVAKGAPSKEKEKPVFSTVFMNGVGIGQEQKLYYEVVVKTGGPLQVRTNASTHAVSVALFTRCCGPNAHPSIPPQIGFLDRRKPLPTAEEEDGVGDVAGSVAWDGGRGIMLNDGLEQEGGEGVEWAAGDVVGVSFERGAVRFSLNGVDLGEEQDGGVAFAGVGGGKGAKITPAVSLNSGEVVDIRLGEGGGEFVKGFEYCPEGFRGAGALLLERKEDEEEEEVVVEAAEEEQQATVVTTTTTTTTVSDRATSPQAAAVEAVPLSMSNIQSFSDVAALEKVPMDVLKMTLESLGLKKGGAAKERAGRLWLVKDLKREEVPNKVRDKATFDSITAFMNK